MDALFFGCELQPLTAVLYSSFFFVDITVFLSQLHADMRGWMFIIAFAKQGGIPFNLLLALGCGAVFYISKVMDVAF